VMAGAAREVLPGVGAVAHLELRDLLSAVEGVEEVVVAGMPEKLLQPEMQDLLRSEHPLLTVLGMQRMGEPLTPESFGRWTGLDGRGSASVTLYLGDPRRLFVVSLPVRAREPLLGALNGWLQPKEVELVTLGRGKAVRVVSARLKGIPELWVLASDEGLYLCGDRSLAIALVDTPSAQRLGQDPFWGRVLSTSDDQVLRFVVNPAPVKPLLLQLQAMRGGLGDLVAMQRSRLLSSMPQEAREQLEVQVRTQLGVKDLDEFADYAECVVVATIEQVLDGVTGGMMAFEGLTVSADVGGGFTEVGVKVYGQRFEEGGGVAAIPMEPVKRALAWLGPQYQSFSAAGRRDAGQDLPLLTAWVERVQRRMESKGLRSAGIERLARLLEERKPIPSVESEVPWTLTVSAPLRPLPALSEAKTLRDYLVGLDLPVHRPVKIIPGQDAGLLERCYRAETEVLNRNRELTAEFVDSLQKQSPWLDQVNRFQADHLDGGVSRLVRESAWATRGGIFGFDQHELVNRKVVWARVVGDYVVYHRGVRGSDWLRGLHGEATPRLAGGVTRLLDRVPEGATRVSVQRVLVGLPALVDWMGELEARAHTDVEVYLREAQELASSAADIDEAKRRIRGLRMPELVGSVAIQPEARRVYALLPGGAPLVLPRPRVAPVLGGLLRDYAAKAGEVGGRVAFTRQAAGVWEWRGLQSSEAITTLTRSVGNALADQYLRQSGGMEALQRRVMGERDGDATVFDEVVARNPQWAFLPQPPPKVDARPTEPIPTRDASADPRMVDLTGVYNAALTESWHRGGVANNTLRDLPRGLQEFGGVRFDVRGIVQLWGQQAARELQVRFPRDVRGVPVACKGGKVHFLHACGWTSTPGTQVAAYVMRYADGRTQEIPVNYGKDVQDWWMGGGAPGPDGPELVWQGKNHAAPDGPSLGLYRTIWNNPFPEVEIESVDYRSTGSNSAPFLIAITVE
jgi:hypothetical protein